MLAEFDASECELSCDEAWEQATLTETFGAGEAVALPMFRGLQQRAPGTALYNYALGTRLLDRDDGAGIEFVERAIELFDNAAESGFQALRDYH